MASKMSRAGGTPRRFRRRVNSVSYVPPRLRNVITTKLTIYVDLTIWKNGGYHRRRQRHWPRLRFIAGQGRLPGGNRRPPTGSIATSGQQLDRPAADRVSPATSLSATM